MLDPSANNVSNQSGVDRTASELLGIVWRRKWLIASCMAVAVLLGVVYLRYAEPIYQVRARVLVQPKRWPLNERLEHQPEKEFLATQAQIVSSPAVIERVVPAISSHASLPEGMDPLLAVQQELSVEPVLGTNVLSVAYDCLVPSEGIATVEGILESYQRFLHEVNDDSRLESLNLLTRSEEKLRGELDEREAEYLDLRRQSPMVGRDRDALTFQWTLLQKLAEALSDARQSRIDLQNRVELLADASTETFPAVDAGRGAARAAADEAVDDQVSSRSRTLVIPVSTRTTHSSVADSSTDRLPVMMTDPLVGTGMAVPPEFDLVSRELLAAEMREGRLAQHCGPKHPDLLAVRGQIASLRQRLVSLTRQAPATLQRELVVATTREDQLLELYEKELQAAKANEDFLVREGLELDGIERLKTIHNSIVAQLNDWHLVEPGEDGGMGVNVVVLEAPTIGIGPVWPKQPLLLSLCAATGMLVGLGIVVARG
jgi:uncharacterized protein involved in exopolysaccharide biosynthesis